MRTFVHIFKVVAVALLLLNAEGLCMAGVTVKESPGRLTLENDFVSLALDASSNYVPVELVYKKGGGRNLIANPARRGDENVRFAYGYLDNGKDKWVDEDNRWEDKFTDLQHSINATNNQTQLIVTGKTKHYDFKRSITLFPDSPEVKFEYEVTCKDGYTGMGFSLPYVPFSTNFNKRVTMLGNYIARDGKRSEKLKDKEENFPHYNLTFPFTKVYTVYNDATQEGLLALPLPEESSGNISKAGKIKIATGDREKVSFKLIPFRGNAQQVFLERYRQIHPAAAENTGEVSTARVLLRTNEFAIWTDYATRRIFPEENLPDNAPEVGEIVIETAKNEYEPFQIAINPLADMEDVRLEFSRLIGDGMLRIIDKENLRYNPVGCLITDNDEEIPDLLQQKDSFRCRKGENTVLWATLKVPAWVSAGTYRGKIGVISKGQKVAELGLKLKVWDFTLPRESHLPACSADYLYTFDQEVDLNNLDEVMKHAKDISGQARLNYMQSHLKFMAEHRFYEFSPGFGRAAIAVNWTKGKDGIWNFTNIDFSAFDQLREYYRDELHYPKCAYEVMLAPYVNFVNQFSFGALGGKECSWMKYWEPVFPKKDAQKYYPQRYDLTDDFTPEFKEKFKRYIKTIADHCRAKGFGIDEQGNGPPFTIGDEVPEFNTGHPVCRKLIDLAKLIKSVDPRIIVVANANRDFPEDPETIDLFDMWSVCYESSEISQVLQKLQAKGKKYGLFYMGEYFSIKLPAIDTRVQFWNYWKYKYNFIGCWTSSQPPINGDKTKNRFFGRINGSYCENWFFPNMKDPFGEPISTIRFEMAREGQEDFEYFWLLRERVRQVKELTDKAQYADIVQEGERLLAAVDALAGTYAAPGEGGQGLWHFEGWERNSAKVYALRQKIGNELETLNRIVREKTGGVQHD